jgi:hypothetical protein
MARPTVGAGASAEEPCNAGGQGGSVEVVENDIGFFVGAGAVRPRDTAPGSSGNRSFKTMHMAELSESGVSSKIGLVSF